MESRRGSLDILNIDTEVNFNTSGLKKEKSSLLY